MTAADHREALDVLLVNARAARHMRELARATSDPFQRILLEQQAKGYAELVIGALPPELTPMLFDGEAA